MNNRLLQFLAAENITQAQFADSINVARAGVSHIIAGRNKPGWDFIINTMNRYPDLNIEWLLTGKGKMYKSATVREDPPSSTQPLRPVAPEVKENTLFDFDASPAKDSDFEQGASINQVVAPGNPPESGGSEAQGGDYSSSPAHPDVKNEVSPVSLPRQRSVAKVIVFFDDGTYQER